VVPDCLKTYKEILTQIARAPFSKKNKPNHLTENPIAIKSLPTHYKVPKYLHLTVISTSVNQYNTPTVHKLARAFISELVRDPSVCTGRPASLRYIFCFGIKIILKLKILFFLMFEK